MIQKLLLLALVFNSLTAMSEAQVSGLSVEMNSKLSQALQRQRDTAFIKFIAKNQKSFTKPYSNDHRSLNLSQQWTSKQDVEALSQNQILGEFIIKDESGLVFSCKEVITFINAERKSFFSNQFLVSESLAVGAQGSLHRYSCSSQLGDFQSTVVNDNYLKYVFQKDK